MECPCGAWLPSHRDVCQGCGRAWETAYMECVSTLPPEREREATLGAHPDYTYHYRVTGSDLSVTTTRDGDSRSGSAIDGAGRDARELRDQLVRHGWKEDPRMARDRRILSSPDDRTWYRRPKR
jgi:hypothetical protein